MPPKFCVVYFDLKFRAETIRLILAQAGQVYEDRRVAGEDWPAFKKKNPNLVPFGYMPTLILEDGTVLSESRAIFRYLGKRYGMAGSNAIETAQIDAFGDAFRDIFEKTAKFYTPKYFASDAEKAVSGKCPAKMEDNGREDYGQGVLRVLSNISDEAKKELLEAVPKQLKLFEDTLKNSDSGWLVGDKKYSNIQIVIDFAGEPHQEGPMEGCLEDFPNIRDHIQKVQGLNRIKKYLKARKETPF